MSLERLHFTCTHCDATRDDARSLHGAEHDGCPRGHGRWSPLHRVAVPCTDCGTTVDPCEQVVDEGGQVVCRDCVDAADAHNELVRAGLDRRGRP